MTSTMNGNNNKELSQGNPINTPWRLVRRRQHQQDDAIVDNDSESIANDREKQKLGMKVALFCTCLTILGSKCSLPATMSILTSSQSGLKLSPTLDYSQSMAKVLTLSTTSIAIGKFFLGPVIDKYGGILSLKLSLTLLSITMFIISNTSSFATFSICWILVDFIFSTSWPSCLNTIYYYFDDEKEWTNVISLLGIASRVGNTIAFASFGFILSYFQRRQRDTLFFSRGGEYWRSVFLVSSIVQFLPLALLSMFHRTTVESKENVGNTQKKRKNKDADAIVKQPTSIQIVKKRIKTMPFWLHLLSRSSLMIYGSFLLFVPSLMMNVYEQSSSVSSNTASFFSFGCLISLSIFGKYYSSDGESKGKKVGRFGRRFYMITSLLSLSTLCTIFHLLHVTNIISLTNHIPLVILSMFLWGFSFAIPYYIPPSIYALQEGGKISSATIMDIFDFVAFGLLAFFNGYVASTGNWVVVFGILFLCSVVSLISLGSFLLFYDNDYRRVGDGDEALSKV